MAVEHERWVIEQFSGLNRREKKQLSELLNRLKSSVLEQPSD